MTHTGQCLCGQVTYTIDAEPLGARMCWCRDCQRIASGSATVNVVFPQDAVNFSGDLGRFRMIADSGNEVERGFCPSCGAQIYSATLNPTGVPIRIRSGTLDNPDLMAPTAIIWAGSAPAWVELDARLPQHDKGPDSPVIETYS